MDSTIVVIVLSFVVIIGLMKVTIWFFAIKRRIEFTESYLQRFNNFEILLNNGEFDMGAYYWLSRNVNKVQRELGNNGISHYYRFAYSSDVFKNYQIVVNTLPRIRSGIAHKDEYSMIEEALLRHIGDLSENKRLCIYNIFNPFVWLREGIRFVITLPILLIYWSGLFEYASFEKASNNIIVTIISSILTIATLISSVVTIVIGWEQTLKIIGLR